MPALTTYFPTLVDLARRLDPNGKIATIGEIIQSYHDMLDDIPWKEGNLPNGNQSTVRTAYQTPTFRLLNQGVIPTKTTTGQIVDACAIIEDRSHLDKDAIFNGELEAFRLSEDMGKIQGLGNTLAETLIYGDTDANPERFNGFATRYFAVSGQTTSTNVIDALGTGSDNTSVYLVMWGDDVCGIYPKGSKAGLDVDNRGLQDIIDPNQTGAYLRAYVTVYQWKCGLSIRDWRQVVRICNIDYSNLLTASDSSDTSTNLLKYMSMAIDKLPPNGRGRPVFYMNNTTMSMLRIKMQDKSNLHLKLEELAGPSMINRRPTLTFQGIPCRRMDEILNTEARVTT